MNILLVVTSSDARNLSAHPLSWIHPFMFFKRGITTIVIIAVVSVCCDQIEEL